jgi:hypothetical protein
MLLSVTATIAFWQNLATLVNKAKEKEVIRAVVVSAWRSSRGAQAKPGPWGLMGTPAPDKGHLDEGPSLKFVFKALGP